MGVPASSTRNHRFSSLARKSASLRPPPLQHHPNTYTNSSSRVTSLAFRTSTRSQLVGARLLPAGQRTLFQAGSEQKTEKKPLLDEDWKDLMVVDYGTGATSSVPPTAVEETRHHPATFESSSELRIFQHWSSGLVREVEDPLL